MYIWDYLKTTNRPIVMYGTGNGGDKLFEYAEKYGVTISAIFASDDRPNNHIFHGLPIETLAKVTERFENPIILLAFGTEREDVISHIKEIAEKFELLAPDLPLCGGPAIDPEYIKENKNEIEAARKLLTDDQSKLVFDSLLDFKNSGKISYLFDCETPADEKASLLKLSNHEHFLDLGAYTGDTIDEFLKMTNGKYEHITALEPNRRNFERLYENKGRFDNITLLQKASWNKNEEIIFTGKNGRNYSVINDTAGKKKSPKSIPALTIDELGISPSFIKMDVEGAEKESLEGMTNTLRSCHPKLQISVYHKTDDFITLINYIEKLCPGYKMYLRHHPSLPAWELQLYCIY